VNPNPAHPVDRLDDKALREILLRVDATDFPSDLQHLWEVERVRYRQTLQRIPPARDDHSSILDLGSTRAWLPFLQVVLGYRRIVLNTNYPDSGFVDAAVTIRGAARAHVEVSFFDIERDPFPHDDESFDVVLCLEVLEHLCVDPMAMMGEVNRVLKPGGTFILTTPNAVRTANVVNAILGDHPYGWAPYNGFDGNRHNREYTPREIEKLLGCGGFAPTKVTTFGNKRRGLARDLMKMFLSPVLWPMRRRRDVVLAVGTKTSNRIERRPSWLYFDMAERVLLDRRSDRRESAAVMTA